MALRLGRHWLVMEEAVVAAAAVVATQVVEAMQVVEFTLVQSTLPLMVVATGAEWLSSADTTAGTDWAGTGLAVTTAGWVTAAMEATAVRIRLVGSQPHHSSLTE